MNALFTIVRLVAAAAPGKATTPAEAIEEVGSAIGTFLPMIIAIGIGVVVMVSLNILNKRHRAKRDQTEHMAHTLVMFGLAVATLVAGTVASPLDHDARDALLSMYGVIISATLALSSTSVVGNAMAGLMLRGLGKIELGDFLQVGEHFGRVSERGLLHTELQTEERNLTTLPNLHLVTNPVTIIRNGAVIQGDVSLGYDVGRDVIEASLIRAAKATGLTDPFVRVMALGDFSVSYRVAGFCDNVKALLSTRSQLNAAMLDALHDDGIEIVSPAFMNQRRLDATKLIPTVHRDAGAESAQPPPEVQIFDKADEAEAKEVQDSNPDLG